MSAVPWGPFLLGIFVGFVACGGGSAAGPSGGTGDDAGEDAADGTIALPGDDGPAAEGASPESGGPPEAGPPPCGTSAWATYGHDAQRTSATDGCVAGALSLAYRYVPAPPSGKNVNGVFTAIAQSDAAFVEWSSQNDPYLGTTAVDRVDASGARVWTWNSGTDSNLANWPTLALGSLVVNDDGLYFLDPASGMAAHSNGVDNWGFTASDAQRVYAVNAAHIDGPGLYVGAYDATEKQLWTKNTYGMCRIDAADQAGGLAVDGATVFYAPSYTAGTGVMTGLTSGVYAFDGATGTQLWTQATTPASAIAAGGGLVFLIEQDAHGAEALVARKQTDGTVAWSVPLTGASAAAPVLAGGRVITSTAMDVEAFDAATGNAAWTAPVTGAQSYASPQAFTGGCVMGLVQIEAHPMTHLAACLASQTLVVTASDGVHILKLADGSAVWTGKVPMAPGAVYNPVVVGKRLYVEDGQALYALDAP